MMEEEPARVAEAEFFGVRVPEGENVVVGVAEDDFDMHFETYHLTQVALGPSPAAGRHTVYMETDGQQKVAIGTLQRDRVEQFQVDFMSQAPVQVSHTGGSDVFVSGFKVIAPIMEEGDGEEETDSDDEPFSPDQDEDEDDDEEEVEDEDDLDEDNEAADPVEVQAMKQHFKQEQVKQQLRKPSKATPAADENDDDDDDEDDEDEDDAGVTEGGTTADGMVSLQAQEFSDMDEEDDDDEDDDEDDDGLEGAGDEDEDDEDDDEEDDEEAPALVARPQAGKKRPAETANDTPQPAKQAKHAASAGKQPQKQPQSQPASAGVTPSGNSAAEQSWANDIKTHLKKNGASKLAALGSSVPKPAGVPKTTKMKKFLELRPDTFAVDPDTQIVTLKH